MEGRTFENSAFVHGLCFGRPRSYRFLRSSLAINCFLFGSARIVCKKQPTNGTVDFGTPSHRRGFARLARRGRYCTAVQGRGMLGNIFVDRRIDLFRALALGANIVGCHSHHADCISCISSCSPSSETIISALKTSLSLDKRSTYRSIVDSSSTCSSMNH